jgi:hypothetical protein
VQIISSGFSIFENRVLREAIARLSFPLFDYRNGSTEHDPRVLAKACREMSRRDGAIVVWHEVPGPVPPQKSRPVGYGLFVQFARRFDDWSDEIANDITNKIYVI